MQRLLAILLVMLLAFTAACGDDSDDDDDDAGDVPTPTLTTGTGTGGDTTATTGEDDDDDAAETEATGDDDDDTGGDGDAANGEQLATSNGCTGCHSTDGSEMAGPTWQGLYGSEVTLEDGSTVTADDEYIAESIRDPSAKIHEGFADIMPKTFADMSDDDVNDIIAYIKTLE